MGRKGAEAANASKALKRLDAEAFDTRAQEQDAADEAFRREQSGEDRIRPEA